MLLTSIEYRKYFTLQQHQTLAVINSCPGMGNYDIKLDIEPGSHMKVYNEARRTHSGSNGRFLQNFAALA